MTLVESYLSHLTMRSMRPSTIKARRTVLTAFDRSLGVHQIREATRQDVEAYLSRPLAPESRRTYRAHLRGFYGWCIDEGHLTDDPTARIPVRSPTTSWTGHSPSPTAGCVPGFCAWPWPGSAA